ncbi:MAG: bifunctional precorrin-2 dehydrogenase/sirohydrochlorin ferrochelatase [Nitrospinota bacterium]
MQRLYPLFVNLEGRACLVVGGGRVAERKVRALLRAGARVRVVAPAIGGALRALARRKGEALDLREERFRPAQLRGMALAFAATDVPSVNARVAEEARRRGIWVNVADGSAPSDFLVPAVVERGSLALAISTGGASPALARRLRKELEGRFGAAWGAYLRWLVRRRGLLLTGVRERAKRERIFNRLAEADLVSLFGHKGGSRRADAILQALCRREGVELGSSRRGS